jgi:hypothetical protein
MGFRLFSLCEHAVLGVKEQEVIQMRTQDWVERYLEAESLFPEEQYAGALPSRKVSSLDEIEKITLELGDSWSFGNDPIENLVQLLEDRGSRWYYFRVRAF